MGPSTAKGPHWHGSKTSKGLIPSHLPHLLTSSLPSPDWPSELTDAILCDADERTWASEARLFLEQGRAPAPSSHQH